MRAADADLSQPIDPTTTFTSPQRTEWLAVRCCCQPTKVFGFLRVPAMAARSTRPMFIPVTDAFGVQHGIEIRLFANGWRNTELAVYSDDRPADFWTRFGEDFIGARA